MDGDSETKEERVGDGFDKNARYFLERTSEEFRPAHYSDRSGTTRNLGFRYLEDPMEKWRFQGKMNKAFLQFW